MGHNQSQSQNDTSFSDISAEINKVIEQNVNTANTSECLQSITIQKVNFNSNCNLSQSSNNLTTCNLSDVFKQCRNFGCHNLKIGYLQECESCLISRNMMKYFPSEPRRRFEFEDLQWMKKLFKIKHAAEFLENAIQSARHFEFMNPGANFTFV